MFELSAVQFEQRKSQNLCEMRFPRNQKGQFWEQLLFWQICWNRFRTKMEETQKRRLLFQRGIRVRRIRNNEQNRLFVCVQKQPQLTNTINGDKMGNTTTKSNEWSVCSERIWLILRRTIQIWMISFHLKLKNFKAFYILKKMLRYFHVSIIRQ